MLKYVRPIVLLSMLLLLFPYTLNAESTIEVGDTIEDTADEEIMTYALPLTEGQSIVIDLVTDDFGSLLVLNDPDGDDIAEDESSGDNYNDSRIIYIAEEDGDYEISVEASWGEPDGDFSLSVTEVEIGVLEYDENVEIDGDEQTQVYFMFEGEEDDVINLFAEANSDDDNLSLYIRGEDGTQLAYDSDSGPGRDPYIRRYVLPDDGIYRIFVNVASDEGLHGDVELTLEETERLYITEEAYEFELADDYEYEVFFFEADSGERYNIVLISDDEESSVNLDIYPPDATYADQRFTVAEFVEISYIFEANNSGETRIKVTDRSYDGDMDYIISMTLLEEE